MYAKQALTWTGWLFSLECSKSSLQANANHTNISSAVKIDLLTDNKTVTFIAIFFRVVYSSDGSGIYLINDGFFCHPNAKLR